jgi:hypothetical protein
MVPQEAGDGGETLEGRLDASECRPERGGSPPDLRGGP